MRLLTTTLISLAGAICAQAATFSLGDCIRTGISNNLSLLNSRTDIDKAGVVVSQNRARLLPVIGGSFQFTGYPVSPVNVTTGTLLGNDFPDGPSWQTIKSMPFNIQTGVLISVPVYDASVYASVDVARCMEEIAGLTYEKGVEQLTVNIARIYYMAQYSRQLSDMLDGNITRMTELRDIAEEMYREGVALEVDLDRARVNLQNIRTAKCNSDMLYCQQINTLRYLLDLPYDEDLELSDDIPEEPEPFGATLSDNLPEIRLGDSRLELIDRRIGNIRAGYIPSVTLNAYAGGLAYQESFDRFFHTSAASRNWFGNCFVGLTVTVPVFDGNARRLRIRELKLERLESVRRNEMIKKQVRTDYDNALLRMNRNLETYRAQEESMRQAESVYILTEELYREGVASMTALLQDEMQLRQAQTACAEARCNYRLARLELLRLSGDLGTLTH